MIFIFGTRARTKQKGEHRFYCPQCGGARNGRRMRVSSYFTFFFIPTLPLKNLGEYIECEACQQKYDLEILDETADKILLRKAYADAVSGMPLQMVSKKLMNEGLNEFEADAAIKQLTDQAAQKQCVSCHLNFLADAQLTSCISCGGSLR